MAHRALTPKEAAFVREYLVDLNAKAAAGRAKYSKKTAGRIGSEVLNRPWVRKAINAEMAKRAVRVEVTADDVLRELLRIARVDVSTAFDENGHLLPIADIPEDVRRAIASIETDTDRDGVTTRKLRFWDKPKALELLGKHLKLFTDKVEMTGDVTINVSTGIER